MNSIENPQPALKVLIVDDDTFIADVLKSVAERLACSVICIHDGKDVGTALLAYKPDVIFLDLVLPGFDGVEIIQLLAGAGCKAKIVLMSGLDKRTLSSVSEFARKCGLDFMEAVTKPFAAGQVESILQPLQAAQKSSVEIAAIGQTATSFGPHILYEPELHLDDTPANSLDWVRASLVWQMDDNIDLAIGSIFTDSAKPKLAKGLIEFTLRAILADKPILNKEGKIVGIKLAISDTLLSDQTVPDFLENIVKRAELSQQSVMFEIEENTIIDSSETRFDVLSRLKIKGFKLAVSIREENDKVLSILGKLPIDELVIDMKGRNYSQNSIGNAETEFQVGSLVSYASKADLVTSVKNVYNEQQLSFAKNCRLAKASGHYFQAPADSVTVGEFYNHSKYA